MIQLSVIIPTRNRAELLFNTLVSIENQMLDQSVFEVIVCDNNSSDNTSEVAHSFADKFQHFRYFKTLEPGLHIGRNKGFQEAEGDILVYADDDIITMQSWLEGVLDSFQDESVVLVGGNNYPLYEVSPPAWVSKLWNESRNLDGYCIGYLSILDFGNEKKEISPYYVLGCNFSIRKNILSKFKGFHPDSMPDNLKKFRGDGESYISGEVNKFKLKTIFNPRASIFHFVPSERMNLQYFYKRAFLNGISNSYRSIRQFKKMNRTIKFRNDLTYYKKNNKLKLKNMLKKITDIDAILEQGALDGFRYHQLEVLKDNQLLEWVLKDNYLD